MNAKYKALDIANWFLGSIDRENGDSMSHLKLQKLLYYSQAWTLALTNKPLFDELIEAWRNGPVVSKLYAIFAKVLTQDALPKPETVPDLKGRELAIVRAVFNSYGEMSGHHLANLTHDEMPWKKAWGDRPANAKSNEPIPVEDMKDFFKDQSSLNEEGLRFIDELNDVLDVDVAHDELKAAEKHGTVSLEDIKRELKI